MQGEEICVFVTPDTDIAQVIFFLDGAPQKIESFSPFDFAGTRRDGSCNPFDTADLSLREHSISATIELEDRSLTELEAVFRVTR